MSQRSRPYWDVKILIENYIESDCKLRLTEGIRVARVDFGDYLKKNSAGDIAGRALDTPETSG